MALSHEILWREREKSSIPFDSDFIYLENWNLPPPPSFPGELFKSLSLSLSLSYSSVHLWIWLAARRPLVLLSLSLPFLPPFSESASAAFMSEENANAWR